MHRRNPFRPAGSLCLHIDRRRYTVQTMRITRRSSFGLFVLALALLATPFVRPLTAADSLKDLFPSDDLSDWVVEFHPRLRERAMAEKIKPFSLNHGVLHCEGSVGNVGFLRSTKQFSDFEFQAEFRAVAGGNNGVCFRAPTYEKETPAHTGYEIQILLREIDDPLTSTGALYGISAPMKKMDLESGQWHSIRILAKGTHIQAWINGTLIQDFDQSSSAAARERPLSGYLFFQAHGGDTDFRNVKMKELPAE